MPTYSVTGNLHAANVIAWSVTGVLVLYWIKLFVRHTDRHELLALSALATLALLPIYHRFMDAVLLPLPLCWCLTTREPKHKRMACVVLLLVFSFMIPGASLLAILAASGRFSNHIVSSWWWNVLVMPHEAWAILAISLSLLYAMSLGCDASNRKIDLELYVGPQTNQSRSRAAELNCRKPLTGAFEVPPPFCCCFCQSASLNTEMLSNFFFFNPVLIADNSLTLIF
jgi:hypothetical protein